MHCLQVYAALRREAAVSHGMPVAVRHLESIIRMSEASAMMHLREYVNEQDVDTAIRQACLGLSTATLLFCCRNSGHVDYTSNDCCASQLLGWMPVADAPTNVLRIYIVYWRASAMDVLDVVATTSELVFVTHMLL